MDLDKQWFVLLQAVKKVSTGRINRILNYVRREDCYVNYFGRLHHICYFDFAQSYALSIYVKKISNP